MYVKLHVKPILDLQCKRRCQKENQLVTNDINVRSNGLQERARTHTLMTYDLKL